MSSLLDLFARPWVLYALLATPWMARIRWRVRRRSRVPFAPLQYRPPHRWKRHLDKCQVLVEILVVVILLVALAGPRRLDRLDLLGDEGIDVALVLDVSLSMLAEDFPPNRLEVLRRLARDFIHRSGNNRLALVVFAGDTYVQAPLTTHHGALTSLLDDVTVDVMSTSQSGGTAIGDALLVAADLLDRFKIEGRDQALVLITDGESNVGSEPLQAARYVRHLGIRSVFIGVGGSEAVEVFYEGRRVGEPDDPYLAILDDRQLVELAEVAEGRYYRASDAGALEQIFVELARLETAPLESRQVEIERPRAGWLAVGLLPLFVLSLVLGGLVLRRPLR